VSRSTLDPRLVGRAPFGAEAMARLRDGAAARLGSCALRGA
jgi:hypothetical protein